MIARRPAYILRGIEGTHYSEEDRHEDPGDRLFGTYVAEPAAGHEQMVIGREQFRHAADLTRPCMLVNPFVHE